MKTRLESCSVVVVLFSLLFVSCGGPQEWGSDPSSRVPSPSGKYILSIRGYYVDFDHNGDKWWHAKVLILTASGEKVYEDTESFAAWFPLRFGWDEQDRLWCYSGDIGIYYWQNGPTGWRRTQWESSSSLNIPQFLGLSEEGVRRRHERGF